MKSLLLLISQRDALLVDGSTVPVSLYLDPSGKPVAKTPKKYGGQRMDLEEIVPSTVERFRSFLRDYANYDVRAIERTYPDDMKSIIGNLWDVVNQLGLPIIEPEEDDEEAQQDNLQPA